jgi:hypothetical protein
MWVSDLRRRAAAAGVSDVEIEHADDAGSPEAALIERIVLQRRLVACGQGFCGTKVSLDGIRASGCTQKDSVTVLHGSEALWTIPNVASRTKEVLAMRSGPYGCACQTYRMYEACRCSQEGSCAKVVSGRYALGQFGHQFQLSAEFSGKGVGLYCGTQPGPYDDALVWPFSRSFALSLVGSDGTAGGRKGCGGHAIGDVIADAHNSPNNVDVSSWIIDGDGHFNKGTRGNRGGVLCTLAELEAGGYIQNDSLLVKLAFWEVEPDQ